MALQRASPTASWARQSSRHCGGSLRSFYLLRTIPAMATTLSAGNDLLKFVQMLSDHTRAQRAGLGECSIGPHTRVCQRIRHIPLQRDERRRAWQRVWHCKHIYERTFVGTWIEERVPRKTGDHFGGSPPPSRLGRFLKKTDFYLRGFACVCAVGCSRSRSYQARTGQRAFVLHWNSENLATHKQCSMCPHGKGAECPVGCRVSLARQQRVWQMTTCATTYDEATPAMRATLQGLSSVFSIGRLYTSRPHAQPQHLCTSACWVHGRLFDSEGGRGQPGPGGSVSTGHGRASCRGRERLRARSGSTRRRCIGTAVEGWLAAARDRRGG
eukprot:366131-Chlamydomonas_euryale.AAC.28